MLPEKNGMPRGFAWHPAASAFIHAQPMPPIRFFLQLCAALAAVGLCGCGSGTMDAKEGAAQKILLVGNGADPRFMDPHLLNSVPEHHVLMALFEGLVAEPPVSNTVVDPGMAERWESNADKSVWTFHLRPNVVWSDGVPVTAGDFVWSWRRMLTKSLAAEYSSMLFVLKNGEDFYNEKVPPEALGVKALDPRTLQVTLVGPTPHFLIMMLHTSWWPVPRHCIEKYGGPYDRVNPWTQEGKMVSNGAFILKRNLFRQVLEVSKNPLYWDAANVKIDGIRFYPIDSESTEERLFRRGMLHITEIVPLDKIPSYREKHPDIFHQYTNAAVYFYRINTSRPALKDVRVRKALAYAIDRESLVKNVTRAGQLPAPGLVPPMEGYQQAQVFNFDPAKAQALLAEAGYPGGKDFPKFEILINTNEAHRAIAEVIQQMWQKTLGIKVGILSQEFSVYLDTMNRIDYDVCRAGWNADYLDPSTFIDMWTTGNGNNNTHWSNAKFDQLVKDATQADGARRMAILREAEDIFLSEVPAIPFYFYTRVHLVHPAVKEYHPKLLDTHSWKHFELISPPPPSTMDSSWQN
jgi:oligopeptide transport system substrate-binding protein